MGLFSRLFGSKDESAGESAGGTRKTTADNPYCINDPAIGFLNLRGSAGEDMMAVDRKIVGPLFRDVRESRGDVPQCAVLFLYGDIDASGRFVGGAQSLREIIKSAGAYIAVVASENNPDYYMKCIEPHNGWNANITLTLNRKGENLPNFFAEVFRRMFAGASMVMAWVELAPQIPGHQHPHAPETIMVPEAGHLAFGRGG